MASNSEGHSSESIEIGLPRERIQRDRRKRSGLGRGLGALIPELTSNQASALVSEIPVDSIDRNPFQPRSEFDDEALDELVSSIHLHGVLQPIIVSRAGSSGRYVLIAGERRLRATVRAGLAEIPALIKDATPQEMLEFALVENVVRADLSPLEEALAYRQLIDEFGLTQQEVAERVGRSRVSVTNTLRLLFAPEPVKIALQSGRISEGHGRALLSLPSAADQVSMLELVLIRDLTVRQTEAAVRSWLERMERPTKETRKRNTADPGKQLLASRLQQRLSTKVNVRSSASGSGVITITFDDEEQLADIVARIAGEPLF